MFLIQEVLISTEVFHQRFVCHLDRCKGACCWEGDFGAPVSPDESQIIDDILDKVRSYLSQSSLDRIDAVGSTYYDETYGGEVITLMEDGACAFLIRDGSIAKCAFEQAHADGLTTWKKPTSCHLYPIRISENETTGFQAMNYSEWDICSAACSLGEELDVPVFRFAREAIERRYGTDFYDEMEALYSDYITSSER